MAIRKAMPVTKNPLTKTKPTTKNLGGSIGTPVATSKGAYKPALQKPGLGGSIGVPTSTVGTIKQKVAVAQKKIDRPVPRRKTK